MTHIEVNLVVDRCSMKKKTGMCRARHQRYYYNSKTKSCERFTYGGCGGNSNNFADIYQCEDACLKEDDYDY